MIRAGIVVEGPTEEDFIKTVLANHLAPAGVWPCPVLPGRGGGNISVQHLASGMRELLHEFEALLFSDAKRFRDLPSVSERSVNELVKARERFATPEDIDDGSATAPSKQLLHSIAGYEKRLHRPLVAEQIGIRRIRSECPRFAAWLKRLEDLPTVLG